MDSILGSFSSFVKRNNSHEFFCPIPVPYLAWSPLPVFSPLIESERDGWVSDDNYRYSRTPAYSAKYVPMIAQMVDLYIALRIIECDLKNK